MASHGEINPSGIDLLLGTSLNALEIANGLLTRRSGDVWIDTGDGKGVLAGAGAADGINRVDEDGNQSPLVDTSGIDKAARDAQKAADDAAAKADDAIRQGEQIRQDAQAGIDDARKQAQDAAAKADKARSDLQAEVDANKKATDTAIAAVDAKADKAQSDLESQTTALKEGIAKVDAKTDQIKADDDKLSQRVDAGKAELDKSVGDLDARVSGLSGKGDQLAGRITDIKGTVDGQQTQLKEFDQRLTGEITRGDTTVKSMTELKQTVTGISSTVSQTAKTASDALSKASRVEQTADGIRTTLSEDYTSTKDMELKYSTKTELEQTADGLRSSITSVKSTAEGAVEKANSAQETADGVKRTLTSDYTSAKDADLKYSTKAELEATSESLSSSLSSVRRTADGAVTAASKAQQTADGVSLDLSKNYQSKAQADATYATRTSLKVTSDSLSASISSTAKTAQSAVDKATSLEANLNGFKTTVRQTYTTKTDFNSLQIGGTNLCPKSNPYNISLSNASKDSSGVITGTVPTNANATWGAGVTPGYATHLKTPYGRQCVISFDVWSEIAATVVVDINNMPESVAAWNGNDNDGWRGGVQPTTTTNGAVACSIPAKQWIRLWVTYSNTSAKNTGKVDIFDQSRIGLRPASAAYQVKFKDFKFELGSRPTEYSPCPSDLQSAGDYATKSELSQTADGIKAQVSEASKTASGAMSKATTLEQTANSLSSTITAQGKTLEATTKTANTAKATADSNTTAISQVKSTADGTVTRISNLEQNLDGFKTTVAKTYQDKAGMSNYATNSALKQTSDTITSQVSEVSKTASGAMSKVTSLEQTANGLSTKITEQGKTLDATVKTANEAKSTADSNKTAISQVSTTANNALSKTSSLEQNLSGFKTSVANTYTTKADFNNLTIGGTNLLLNTSGVFVGHPSSSGVNANAGWLPRLVDGLTYSTLSAGTYQLRFEVMTDTEVGSYTVQWADTPWLISSFSLSKGVWKTLTYTIVKPDGATGKARGFMLRTDNVPTSATIRVRRAKLERGSRPTDWSPAPQDSQAAGDYATNSSLTQTASQIRSEVAEKYQSKSGMSSYATTSALTQKANEITGKVQEVAKTAQGNTTTISQVSQKADKINTTLSQKIDGKADVSRVSSLEQSLSGFKTSVAQSYQPKGDYPTKTEMQSNISQSASSIKSEVANTYTTQTATEALRKSATRTFQLFGANGTGPKWVKLGYLTSNGDASSILLHVYSGNGWNGNPGQNAEFEIFVKDGYQSTPSANGAFGVSVQRIRNADDVKVKVLAFSSGTCDIWAYLPWNYWNGHYTLQGDYRAWQDGPDCGGTRIQDNEPTNGTPQNLAYDTFSTRSYVDQTSKSVALGVVQNYKGADGSGLATKSDITVSERSITSTVAGTYATKSGVTQEISSKITQNNNSLDVRFATKTETKAAQNTANAAKSDASNAQSRVGTLESCISLTSDGVQVGKRSNGVFTGPSALVGTDGAFHVKNSSPNSKTDDVAKLGQDILVVKSKIAQRDGGYLDRLTVGPYGDDHFAIRLSPALAADASASPEPVQMWQTGWQNITTGKGCEVSGYASYGYRGGCLRFRGRVRTTIDGDNSLFANPGVLNLWVSTMNRNFLLPAYRNNTLGWTNAYIPANSRQVRINGVWDWVSLDQLSIAQ